MNLAEIVPRFKLMPLLVADRVEQVVEDATTYRDAGYPFVEILCRTPCAVDAIRETHRQLPDLFIGAGTVLSVELAEQAVAAGAQFLVSPACDPVILDFAKSRGLQMIPGVYTPTEVAVGLRYGFTLQKLFPAEPAGGLEYISGLASPYGHTPLKLVCGHGVSKALCPAYLQHPLVGAVIADWLPGLRGKALRDEVFATKAWFQGL